MKTTILSLMLLATLSVFSQEISNHAIGLRLGSNKGIGVEISYQRALGDNNRLEGDFNWYAGAGGGLASWSSKFNNSSTSGTYFLGAGNIGVEYNFDIPLMISLDLRPELYFGSGGFGNNFGADIAISVRYKF
jgi:hypothetical protein